MSGGSLDYFYCSLENHIGDFKDKELDDLIRDLSDLFYEREWYLSGDTCEGKWNEARDKFKKKWFTENGRRERIEKYLHEIRQDVLGSFGIGSYCQHCSIWIPDKRVKGYGSCRFNDGCLGHRSETACEKFVPKAEEAQE